MLDQELAWKERTRMEHSYPLQGAANEEESREVPTFFVSMMKSNMRFNFKKSQPNYYLILELS